MRTQPRKITPTDRLYIRAVARADLGIGNKNIVAKTRLTDGQINGRLQDAKRRLKRKKGFRVLWREGNHPLLGRIIRDNEAIMVQELERTVVPKLEHPKPKS